MRTATSSAISILPYEAFGEAYEAFHHVDQDREPLNFFPQRESASQGIDMSSNGYSDRSVVGRRRNNSSGLSQAKNDNQDWIAARIAQYPVAEVVACTGMTEKAVQNIRRGKSKMSFDYMTELARAKPDFAAAWAEHVGLILPGSGDYAAALTKAVNAYVRQQALRGEAK